MKLELKDLVINVMLVSMFPNLNALANSCLPISASAASLERSFSQMKMIKTWLRSRIRASSLSHLMKIAIESPENYPMMILNKSSKFGIEILEGSQYSS